MKRRTALLSGLAAITGAFVPRLFRRGLPAADPVDWGSMFAVDRPVARAGFAGGVFLFTDADAKRLRALGIAHTVVASSRVCEGQLVALRPDVTVGPAT